MAFYRKAQDRGEPKNLGVWEKKFSYLEAMRLLKNPAIVRTLLLLHNRHFERRHTSHSGTNLQKSAKN
jgi:hypothetical protein